MPEVTRAQIVEAALSYEGIPYADGGSTREDGMNCAGVLVAVGRDLGYDVSEIPGRVEFTAAEPMDDWFEQYMDRLPSVDEAREGDVISMLRDTETGSDGHCAILVERSERGLKYSYVVHALRNHGVVKGRLFGRYLRGVTGAWRLRGVVD